MAVYDIIIWIMAVFAVLGGLDRIFGNHFGLGKQFEEGILAMGSLALAMLGIIAAAPILSTLLKPIVVPVFSFLAFRCRSISSMPAALEQPFCTNSIIPFPRSMHKKCCSI